MTGERAHRHGRVRRAERRDTGRRDRARRPLGHQRESGDVRGLALVGRHAERRVALQVLDGPEPFALGELDVVRGDVVLEIDEGLAAAVAHAPERLAACRFTFAGRWRRHCARAADGRRGGHTRAMTALERLGQRELAVRGTGHDEARRQRRRARTSRATRRSAVARPGATSGAAWVSSHPTRPGDHTGFGEWRDRGSGPPPRGRRARRARA